jgi:hypothetical protein
MIALARKSERGWDCYACGALIAKPMSLRSADRALEVPSLEVAIRSDLLELKPKVDGMKTFGLPQRTLTRGREP